MAQRALSQSWVSPLPESTESDLFSISQTMNATQFGSGNISCLTEAGSSIQFSCNNGLQHHNNAITYPSLDVLSSYDKPINPINFRSYPIPAPSTDIPTSFMFSPIDMPVASMLPNLSPSALGDVEKVSTSIDFGQTQQCDGFTVDLPLEINGHLESEEEEKNSSNSIIVNNNQWATLRAVSFPFNLPSSVSEEWKPNMAWDSPPCPSEMSTSFSTNNCYT